MGTNLRFEEYCPLETSKRTIINFFFFFDLSYIFTKFLKPYRSGSSKAMRLKMLSLALICAVNLLLKVFTLKKHCLFKLIKNQCPLKGKRVVIYSLLKHPLPEHNLHSGSIPESVLHLVQLLS